jgi:hypothetical protein
MMVRLPIGRLGNVMGKPVVSADRLYGFDQFMVLVRMA